MTISHERRKGEFMRKIKKPRKQNQEVIFEDQRRFLMHTLSTCAQLYFRISMGHDDCYVCLALSLLP